MSLIYELFRTSVPLALVTMGALASEYAGTMAVFADGFINLGAFLFYFFTTLFNSAILGFVITIFSACLLAFVTAVFTQKLKANPFLTGLALNVAVSGIISLLSVEFFGTRGVLTLDFIIFDGFNSVFIVWCGWFCVIILALLLSFSKLGIYLKAIGSDKNIAFARGLNVNKWQIISWCIAACFSAFAGCVLVSRINSFVPNISAGRGWTGLAAVFLGRKKIPGVFVAIAIFTLAEFTANNIQRIPIFNSVSSAFLLSLPYIVALLLIGFSFHNKKSS